MEAETEENQKSLDGKELAADMDADMEEKQEAVDGKELAADMDGKQESMVDNEVGGPTNADEAKVCLPLGLQTTVDAHLREYHPHKAKFLNGSHNSLFSKTTSNGSNAEDESLFELPVLPLQSQLALEKDSSKGWRMIQLRLSLPAYKERDAILNAISQNQISRGCYMPITECAQETIQESCVLALAYKPLRDMTITDSGFGSAHIGIIKSLDHPFDDIHVSVKRGFEKFKRVEAFVFWDTFGFPLDLTQDHTSVMEAIYTGSEYVKRVDADIDVAIIMPCYVELQISEDGMFYCNLCEVETLHNSRMSFSIAIPFNTFPQGAWCTPPWLLVEDQGAATTCYIALNPKVKGVTGKYFSDSNLAEPSTIAKDQDLAEELWDFSLGIERTMLSGSLTEEIYFDFQEQPFIYLHEKGTFYKLPYPTKETFAFYLSSTGYDTDAQVQIAADK
ncbi:hypothetical protein Tco_0118073 [Tanacetum coccineum]